MTRVVKEGYIYVQTYRGSASRGLQSPFLPVPLSGAHRFFPIITQGFNPGSSAAWGHPCPCGCRSSKKTSSVTKVVKEGYIYDQTYRGFASRGLQSPFLFVPLSGAHRFLPIIAQDFSPGSSSVPFFTRAPIGSTPLLPNHNPGLQSWVVLRAGRKSSKQTKSVTRV